MPFTTPVKLLVPLIEGDEWETIEPLNFRSELRQKHYVVPANFKTDLASHWTVRGSANAPAVLHDWLYRNGIAFRQIEDREEADDVFLEAMIATGVPVAKAKAMYWAVRQFGGYNFQFPSSGYPWTYRKTDGCSS